MQSIHPWLTICISHKTLVLNTPNKCVVYPVHVSIYIEIFMYSISFILYDITRYNF